LTNQSLHRLAFAAHRYKIYWTEKRETMLKGREQSEDAKDQFIDAVFNNHDFWKNVKEDWNKSQLIPKQTTKDKASVFVVVVFDESRELMNDQDPNSSLFLAIRRSLADAYAYDIPSLNLHMFGVFIDTSYETAKPPSIPYSPSARMFQGSNLFNPFLLPGMKDVRYDDNQDWLQDESVVGLGRPMWAAKRRKGGIGALQEIARLKLLTRRESKFNDNGDTSYRQDLAVVLCRLGLFLCPVASMTRNLVADHMATVYACDKDRESMLVSYSSEPILAFGAMKQWKGRGLGPLLKSIRTALIRGIVKEGAMGEISAMILLLKSMDELNAGLGWGYVQFFLENLALVNNDIKEELGGLIPKQSQLNFNHFVEWFDRFDPSDICLLLRRRAACILQRNQDGAELLIPFFFRAGKEVKFGAILVLVKNGLQASDAKDVGRKLFTSSAFKHWDKREKKIPVFRVVLERGLCRANKQKSQSIPMEDQVELLEVSVTRDYTAQEEKSKAVFIMTSSDSQENELIIVPHRESHIVKEGKVKFLRLRGIAGVPWMDEPTYDCFIELLEGPCLPRTLSSWTEGVNTACFWKEQSIFVRTNRNSA
jgi:hypothetical protein